MQISDKTIIKNGKELNNLEWISNKLVDAFVELGIIEKEKKDNYLYGAEFLFMKIIGIIIMGVIGILTHKIIETIVFIITFNSLRKYTNGYHSEKPLFCIIESVITYLLICLVLSEFLINYIYPLHIITLISLFIIYVLSPVNSDSIMLNKNEIKEHKENIKYIILIDLVVLAIFVNFKMNLGLVVFFDLAILLDLLLVLIGLIINMKGGSDEKC